MWEISWLWLWPAFGLGVVVGMWVIASAKEGDE